jgi:hypothetical protein
VNGGVQLSVSARLFCCSIESGNDADVFHGNQVKTTIYSGHIENKYYMQFLIHSSNRVKNAVKSQFCRALSYFDVAMHNNSGWKNPGSDKIHGVCWVISTWGWCAIFCISEWALAVNKFEGIRYAQRQFNLCAPHTKG